MGDGMKTRLKIQLNDQAKWLFAKVDSLHGAKITWKQIRKYLEKTISVRDEMRDFFLDNARDRDYEEKKAEIVNGISDAVEAQKEATETMEEKLLAQLFKINERMSALESKLEGVGGDEKSNDVQIRIKPKRDSKHSARMSEKIEEMEPVFVSSKLGRGGLGGGDGSMDVSGDEMPPEMPDR